MSRDILVSMADRIIAGLNSRSITTPSRWAQAHARNQDGSHISYRKYPWQREMLDSKAPWNVAAKGAQMGVSRMALLRGMAANDLENRDVLYVLPNMHPLGSDFSNTRFDGEVRASTYLTELYISSNVGLKQTATNFFYVRGAQSKAGGKSVPAGFLIIDEINEVPKEFLPLVRERMSGQDLKTEWDISTPTLPECGISKLWDESTQEYFMFPCPHCSTSGAGGPTKPKLIHLTYPECLEIVGEDPDSPLVLKQSYMKCPDCKGRLEHSTKAELFKDAHFVPSVNTDKDKRGFHVNQLYSATVTPGEFAASAIRSRFSEADAQEFWNSKLGLAHVTDGAKVTDEMLEKCKRNYVNGTFEDSLVVRTLGVDVGSRMHFEIDEWWIPQDVDPADPNASCVPKVVACGFVHDPSQLDALMSDWRINAAVIDAMPETRMSFAFAQRWAGHVKMCYYAQGTHGRILTEGKFQNGEPVVNANRTAWLDCALGRFRSESILLPLDLPFEYQEHVKVMARVWKRAANGEFVVSYENQDKADHHAHARVYAEMALYFALGIGTHQRIRSPR